MKEELLPNPAISNPTLTKNANMPARRATLIGFVIEEPVAGKENTNKQKCEKHAQQEPVDIFGRSWQILSFKLPLFPVDQSQPAHLRGNVNVICQSLKGDKLPLSICISGKGGADI
ncbi:hypothetical protein T03_16235 [Trichinella britovi]|uniref:Uncharacterized protein n=1 Tax=Trichinella britovi TaxID=45882 RepID=A0A0V1CFP4_TRIBR|nr:hypothetical protein T03_16235 [Trichinella britovi]